MFSLTNKKTKIVLHIIKGIVLGLIAVVFLVSCALYAFKSNIIFPIVNSCLLISTFFLFKGKYRLYALFFAMPFIIFFNYKPLGVGSFYSYSVILYCFLIVIEFLFSKNKSIDNLVDLRRAVVVLVLAVYSIILTFVNSGLSGVVRTVSIFAYLACVSLFFFDKRAKKDLSILIITIGTSLLLANAFAYFIMFFIKGDIAIQFLERFMSRDYAIHYKANNESFRFPGLTNDPNYLGFYTLLISAVVVMSFKSLRFRVPIVVIVVLLQVFPLIGESKNYFLVIVLLALIVALVFMFKKNGVFISVGVLLMGLVVLLVFGNSLLLPVLLRFINIDFREGFLNAMTTGRISIQLSYFNHYISQPTSFLFGRGFNSLLNNASAHNVYVMTFWYFGIIGTVLFYYWIFTFLPPFKTIQNKLILLPLFIMAVYALSLDYVSYSEMFLFVLFLCCLSINDCQNTKKKSHCKGGSYIHHETTI